MASMCSAKFSYARRTYPNPSPRKCSPFQQFGAGSSHHWEEPECACGTCSSKMLRLILLVVCGALCEEVSI